MAVAENPRQPRGLTERVHQVRRKRRRLPGKIAPVERNWHPGEFPMARGGVLAARDFCSAAVMSQRRSGLQPGWHPAGGQPATLAETKPEQIGDLERTTTH